MPIPVILGQTGTGKTQLGMELASHLNIEIISSDSRQIYKYLTIGTNKPVGEWKSFDGDNKFYVYQGINFHLVDFLNPKQEYNAGMFVSDTTKVVSEIKKRKNIPIIIGGTGLYIKSFVDGLSLLPERNQKIRDELENLYKIYGSKYLYQLLFKLDPKRAIEIHPNNVHRIIRALEIIKITQKPVSSLIKEIPKTKKHKVVMIGLKINKETLKKRIILRTDFMFKNGLIEETKNLLSKGYSKTDPGLSSIGYNWVIEFIQGKIDLKTAKENFVKDTLRYAKNQNVWFKKDNRIIWLDCDSLNFKQLINKTIQLVKK